MSYLIVAAHPDDEVLGAGGLIYCLSHQGEIVDVCILSAKAEARAHRPTDEELDSDMRKSMNLLGARNIYEGEFPNIKLNTVPHIELVQFIEKAILDSGADHIITHHPSDLNHDHYQTSLACQEAARLFQRRNDVKPLQSLLFMEVPSSTEWAFNTSIRQFTPDTFVEIGKEGLEKKLSALSCYRGVMREYPHPRSYEAIQGLAAYRGSQAGSYYAEAFETAFRRIGENKNV